jgi:hypothetical protein
MQSKRKLHITWKMMYNTRQWRYVEDEQTIAPLQEGTGNSGKAYI